MIYQFIESVYNHRSYYSLKKVLKTLGKSNTFITFVIRLQIEIFSSLKIFKIEVT